mgnify:FL=1
MFSLLFAVDLKNIEKIKNWNKLQDHPVIIEWCMLENFMISKAEKILNHDIHEIAQKIQDLESYPIIFKRVTKASRLGDNSIHIILDMPFPFEGRDYIIEYDTIEKPGYWMFSYSSVKKNFPLEKGHVRLPNAAGVWVLHQLSKHRTKVVYAWNGELLGNFPDFGLERAWVTQGTEVINWLDEALMKQLKS